MELCDSRRLPGANLLGTRPGAVIDAAVEPGEVEPLLAAWHRQARCILDAVGWSDQECRTRAFAGGVSLMITAPLDALYAATEVNEWAFASARACLEGGEVEDSAGAAERLRTGIAAESNPRLRALRCAAGEHGVAFLSDDDRASVGLGAGSQTWAVDALPRPDEVDWTARRDVPTALVTGTNGKTTTVRMLAAVARAAGRTAGTTSTDHVCVGDEVLERGDWSGPGGARRVLREPAVEVAILETARGGMLRRGLALERADVAAVLNVGSDHLGEWGVGSLEVLCEGKFVVTSVAETVVLNADDPVVSARGRALGSRVCWFGLDTPPDWLAQAVAAGGRAFLLEGGALVRRRAAERTVLLAVEEVPVALGGAARYQLSNALACAAVAEGLGFSPEEIAAGLRGFSGDEADNPGRANRFDLAGIDVIVDFAHNPHGMRAFLEAAGALPAERRLVVLGQAGDRDDESILELARVVGAFGPERVVLKELAAHSRGRGEGEVLALLARGLTQAGLPEERWTTAPDELAAVDQALAWALPGDQLLLLAHEAPGAVLERLRALCESGWAPGQPVA
ncbi:MAG: Mur ligase family protein [Planctomycetota bacterium]|jgi:UDP-N-acetylmuramyl tripeptide synthase|nr:Mur ligase family protein [Planctomycetota bacterium]MDP6762562.1 Mur ligase family protein [Planctomycetota bacterium]MDP6990466.1 Mur ligase family protein [Planctomycetota bacterium]